MEEKLEELEIIVSLPGAFGAIDVSDHEEIIKEWIGKGSIPLSGGFYLDGIVERAMGYDKFVILNGEAVANIVKDENGNVTELSPKSGHFKCNIKGYSGVCEGYFWPDFRNEPRGLVFDITDVNAKSHAEECYEKKKDNL